MDAWHIMRTADTTFEWADPQDCLYIISVFVQPLPKGGAIILLHSVRRKNGHLVDARVVAEDSGLEFSKWLAAVMVNAAEALKKPHVQDITTHGPTRYN